VSDLFVEIPGNLEVIKLLMLLLLLLLLLLKVVVLVVKALEWPAGFGLGGGVLVGYDVSVFDGQALVIVVVELKAGEFGV